VTVADREPARRFFFVHVHKAAGTSLLLRLRRQFPPEQLYPDDSDVAAQQEAGALPLVGPTMLVSHLLARYPVRRHEIVVVAGHFPVRTTELLGDPFTTLTLVREPVERILSSLRHHRRFVPADRDRPLEELYDDPYRFHGMLHNHLVKMFSLSPEEIRAGDGMVFHVEQFTPARLAEAKSRLAAVDVLGLHDHVDELCDRLTERFGWRLGAPVHANVTEPVPVAESFRRRIAADNALDAELYEHARELWASRRAEG
jgi:hypothetical protein